MHQIGEYEIERELARGGMGVVYVARHLQLGRRVALKLLTSPLNKRSLDRFRVEAQAVAQLDHPNIVKIHEVGIDSGRPYLTMELVEGEPLSDLVDREPLDPRQAAVLVEALARAVEHAHVRGILHRDLKPSNVLLTPDGQPLLTDFGLARELSDERERLTRTGEVLGTPGYMPPEQADGRVSDVGPTSDVYGLGATLFSLLCGRPPFLGGAIPAIIAQVLHQSPPSPRALRPEVDPDLEGICLRALEKEPRDRYPSAAALADDLLRYLRGEPVTQPRRRRAWKVPGLALAGVLAIAALVAVLSSPPTPSPTTPATAPAPTKSASAASPTPAPATAPTPFSAPTRLRLDWRARPPLAKPGEWFGGFLPNGHAIAYRRSDARAWRITGPGTFEPLDLPGACQAIAIAGRRLIVVVGREVLTLDPPRAPRLLYTLDPEWKTLDQLEVAPNGRTLAFAGRHGEAVRVVVLDTGRPGTPPRQGAVRTETRPVTCLALADDLVLGAGGFDVRKLGEGVVYRAPLGRFPAASWEPWSPQTGYPTAIAISPGGLIAIGSSGGQAYLFRDGLRKRPTPLKGKAGILGFAHQGAVRGLVFSADGAQLYTAAGELNKKEGELAVWALDPSGPRVIEKRKELGRAVRELHLSPDQRRLLVLTQQGPELWSVPKP